MKRKIVLIISLVFFILVTITYYYISPAKSINYYEASGDKNIIQVLMNLSGATMENSNLEVQLSEDNVNELIESLGVNLKYRAEINKDTLDIYVPTKVMYLVDTYYKLTFSLSAEDGDVVLKLIGSKLGKLNISNKTVLDNISNYSNKDIIVDSKNNKIIVNNTILYFNYLEVSNGEVTLNCNVNNDELQETLKNSLEDILNIFKQ